MHPGVDRVAAAGAAPFAITWRGGDRLPVAEGFAPLAGGLPPGSAEPACCRRRVEGPTSAPAGDKVHDPAALVAGLRLVSAQTHPAAAPWFAAIALMARLPDQG